MYLKSKKYTKIEIRNTESISARLIINTHNISAFVLPLAGQKSRFKKIGANAHPASLPPTDTRAATM